MEAVIQSNIPLPPAMPAEGPRSDLGRALGAIKVGESFSTARRRGSIYSLARYYGIHVAIRKMPDGQLRVWRVPFSKQPTKKAKNKNDENANRVSAKQG
jgi:hypothetical protein